MNYDPIIAFCRQRISDLGGDVMTHTVAPQATVRPGMAESSKRAVVELQMVITLCEGLNKVNEALNIPR